MKKPIDNRLDFDDRWQMAASKASDALHHLVMRLDAKLDEFDERPAETFAYVTTAIRPRLRRIEHALAMAEVFFAAVETRH
jgi:hypothetical protein